MIRFFYFAGCFIVFILPGCDKKVNPVKNSAGNSVTNQAKQIRGSWELHSWYGGNRANNGSNESEPGNGNVYTFTANHFEHYEDHKLLDSGTYVITKSRSAENGDPLDAFAFNRTDTIPFILTGDTLTLNPRAPMYDGVARKYVRVYVK